MGTRVRLEFLLFVLLTFCDGLNITVSTESLVESACESTSLCNPQDECSSVSPSSPVSCRCDPVCLFFRDCCPDYLTGCANVTLPSHFLDATENLATDQLSCMVPPHSNSSGNDTEFSVVDKCASDWSNELTGTNCEGSARETDIFSLTPVSHASSVSFKNAYCAICNRRSIFELTPWSFQFECGSQIPNVSSNATFQERIRILMENCDNWFFIPPSSGLTDVRVCLDRLDNTCQTEIHTVQEHLSLLPLVPFGRTQGGDVPDSLGLDYDISPHPDSDVVITNPFPPISVLVDFTSLDEAPFLEEVVSVVCDQTEVYDPSLKTCVTLSCPAGYSLLNRSCVVLTELPNQRCSNNNQIPSTAKLSCEHKALGESLCAPSWSIANETVLWFTNKSDHLQNISVQEIVATWRNSSGNSGVGTCVQIVTVSFDSSKDFIPFRQSSENVLLAASGIKNVKRLTCRISEVDVSVGCVRRGDRRCRNDSISFSEFKVLKDSSRTMFFVSDTNTSYQIEDSLYIQRFRWNIDNSSNIDAELLVCNRREYSSHCALVTLNISDFVILSNGSALYEPFSVLFDPDDYTLVNNDSVQVCSFLDDSGNLTHEYYFIAFSPGQSITSFVGCVLSIAGLVVTFITYVKFESLRKSICSRLVMSVCVSLTLAQLTLLFSGIAKSNPISCTCLAVLGHYFWLVVFAHSVALALDLYRRFGLTQKVKKTSEGLKLLSLFLVFGWGLPLLVVIPCLVVHLCKLPHVALTYGTVKSCWIGNGFVNLYAFGVPMALTLVINGTLFVLVVAGLRRRTSQTTKRKTSKTAIEAVIYLKMSTLLGFTWIFGFVAAFADVSALWYIFIILNSLQGVYIFIAFICNKRVFKLWRESCSCKPCVSLTVSCPCSRSLSDDSSTSKTTSSIWNSSSMSSIKKEAAVTSISMTEASSIYSVTEMQQNEAGTESSALKKTVSVFPSSLPSGRPDKPMNESMPSQIMAELRKKIDRKV